FLRTIAAALAHEIIDENALGRIGIQPTLAASALFGRARLIVYQNGHSIEFTKVALHAIELIAVMDADPCREKAGWILGGLIRDHNDALRSLRDHLGGDLIDGEAALRRLAARH